MVPLIQDETEIVFAKNLILKTAAELFEKLDKVIEFKIGTMIELPRACINAASIAANVDFFSFGTNDLTQTTMGISRDDAGKFLEEYQKLGLLAKDPFKTIDKNGVGELIKIAIKEGKRVNSNLKIGICGEHGGDVESIEFFASIGLNYVSCSPYRLPTAKLKVTQLSV
jgi:pyruvate, orthophosphate dikinase